MTPASQFESAHGVLVPRDPDEPAERLIQERQEERINAPRLLKYLNRTLDSIASLDQSENLRIHNEMVRCVAYYDGRWDGQVKNGEWVDNEVIPGQIQPADNEYKKQIDKLQMEMCRGRIGFKSEASNKFNAEMREAAQFAEHRIKVNQNRIETEPFVQGENMSLLLKFITFRYTFFDQNADSSEKSIEMKVMKHLTEGQTITVCRTCGMTAPDKTLARSVANDELADPKDREVQYEATKVAGANCPHCGDTETTTVGAAQSEGIKQEQSKKPAGRVVTVRPDATMVQLDLNGRDIESSSFVRWRLVLRRCDWEAFFPNTRIPSSDESTEGRERSEAQNTPSNSGWDSASDVGGGDQFEKIEGELVWLDSKVYQRYQNKENETLGDDRVLPAGAKLLDQFPSGVCVARIGKKILDLFPSNKNKCWTMCVYGLREHALHGSGTRALLGPQDTITELNSGILANVIYNSAGRDLVRSGVIEGGKLPSVNEVSYVNAPPEVPDIARWAAGKIHPEALSGEVYAFRDAMRGSLQDGAGTSSLSTQGAADAKQLGTATGVEASRDQAVGRMIPNRKLQAFMGSEWARQVLELERENYSPEMFFESAGKCDEKGNVEYTERGVRAFFNSEVRNDFMITAEEGSWMPMTPAQEKANAAAFAQAYQQVEGNPQAVALIAPAFGQDFSVDEWGSAQRNASMRLEEYAKGCAMFRDVLPTEEIVDVVFANVPEWAKVNPQMDTHEAFMNFYTDWWLSDEGRNANPLLRLFVQTIHGEHKKGLIIQAQEQSAAQIAANAPQKAVEEQLSQAQEAKMAEESAAAEAKAEEDTVKQALGTQMLKERDREHASEVKMDETEHAAMVDAVRSGDLSLEQLPA